MQIKIKRGLDIPIEGKPFGKPKPLSPSGRASETIRPKIISLNVEPFEELRFQLLRKIGEKVKVGEPILEDKGTEGRMFVSPAAGTILEVRRGLKRRILDILIDVDEKEEIFTFSSLDPEKASKEEILDRLKTGGCFAKIRKRPFDLLADPEKTPRSIFVKGLESAPFAVPSEMQVEGNEEDFAIGLKALSKLTTGKVHLVYYENTTCKAFLEAKNVEKHTALGPHPISNHSLHIQMIDPIQKPEDLIWTVTVLDVIAIGHLLRKGEYRIEKIVSLAGTGIVEDQRGFVFLREGFPIVSLLEGRIEKGWMRLISGDVLTGKKVENDDFLHFYDTCFCVIPENSKREFLHFFRLGGKKYSMSGAYLSGHLSDKDRTYSFTTNQHGEKRAFIDSTLYKKVMPLHIPTMFLVKAVMVEDYDLAESLGLLEVAGEDFALPTFVDPSKIEMMEIIHKGLKSYAKEVLE